MTMFISPVRATLLPAQSSRRHAGVRRTAYIDAMDSQSGTIPFRTFRSPFASSLGTGARVRRSIDDDVLGRRENAMSATGVDVFDKTLPTTNI
jgi:hypothetical protein